jgi:hypothetical protein
MKTYRNFIREAKREINKSLITNSNDIIFEKKFNSCLLNEISINEFENYLFNEFNLNINESKIQDILEKGKKLYQSISEKVNSIFNNLYDKIKSGKGLELIISFFDSVSEHLSKISQYIKNTKLEKNIKKMLITLGVSTTVGYILSTIKSNSGSKTSEKINYIFSFDQFLKESLTLRTGYESTGLKSKIDKKSSLLNIFLKKIDALNKKTKFPILTNFYESVLKKELNISPINKEIKSLRSESRTEESIKNDLKNIIKILWVERQPNLTIKLPIRLNNKSDFYESIDNEKLKEYLNSDIGRKTGDIHKLLFEICKEYGVVKEMPKIKKAEPNELDPNELESSDLQQTTTDIKDSDELPYQTEIDKKEDIGILEKLFRSFGKYKLIILVGSLIIIGSIMNKSYTTNINTPDSFEQIMEEDFEKEVNKSGDVIFSNDTTNKTESNDEKSKKIDLSTENGLKVKKVIEDSIKEIGPELDKNKTEISKQITDTIKSIHREIIPNWMREKQEMEKNRFDINKLSDEDFSKLSGGFIESSSNYNFLLTEFGLTGRNLVLRTLGETNYEYDDSSTKSTIKGSIIGDPELIWEYKIFKSKKDTYVLLAVKRDKLGGKVSEERWKEAIDSNKEKIGKSKIIE